MKNQKMINKIDTPIVEAFWQELRDKAAEIVEKEPMMRALLDEVILNCMSIEQGIAKIVASKLQHELLSKSTVFQICIQAFNDSPKIIEDAIYDMRAVCARDPASSSIIIPYLFLKGPQVLIAWRVAHWLWTSGRTELARFFQSIISEVYSVDIHPAAKIGHGVMLDHATGLVVGETAVIADRVSILQDVTLGGTGKDSGDRHPKIGRGVMIGAGAKILGNIKVGEGAKIGAGSVVLKDVEPHTTVAGVPARQVGKPSIAMPSSAMDQGIDIQTGYCPESCGIICSKRI